MNHLFGTNFSVLKVAAGTRTTRGIWVSSEPEQKFIVFDVEGNDSMDRAEEQVTRLLRRTTRRWWRPMHW